MKAKLFLSLFILTGLFISAQTGITKIDSIKSNNIWRTYRLYKPLSYTGATPYPLVMNFHGYTSNSFAQQYYGNFMPIADTAKFLVVHPQGTLDGSNQPYWNAGISPTGAKDLQFVSELIDSLKAHYNIDLNCVYSTGLSNGGFLSNYLACNLSNKVAAIASVSGTMFLPYTCNPPRAVPAMHIHGTADGTVPYAGTGVMMAADSVMKYWRTHNNCGAVPTSTNLVDIVPGDGCTATRYLWSGGTNGATDELYKINGGGHTWPGATTIIGVTNQDFNASVEIWRFFRKYKLSMFTGIQEFGVGNSEFGVYPNPATDHITIKTDKQFTANVFDIYGGEIEVKNNSNTIDVSSLNSGIYFLRISSEGNYFTKKIIKE